MTEGQLQTIEFVKKFIRERGISPTIADIARARNTSTTSAYTMVQRLICKGYLGRADKGWRNIVVRKAA